jgi:LysR family glycine cleavage system transcriptional activator
MSWHLPSLTALRIFEAAARHLSFTKAADELHITQSAVSRQIRLMEEYLGLLLFQRVKQRLTLTDAGQTYVQDIRAGLCQLHTATVNMLAHQGKSGALNIGTAPAFCTKWLIPRLGRFTRAHPNVVINLSTRDLPFDLDREGFDAAFHYGANDWPGVLSDALVGHELVIVGSPRYLAEHARLRKPADLVDHVLLQHTRRPNKWRDWLEEKGATKVNGWAGPRFEHFYMVTQAAIAHLGVALVPRLLVEDDLAAGRLVVALDEPYTSAEGYCLVYSASKRNDPRLELFRRWLLAEAARSGESSEPEATVPAARAATGPRRADNAADRASGSCAPARTPTDRAPADSRPSAAGAAA